MTSKGGLLAICAVKTISTTELIAMRVSHRTVRVVSVIASMYTTSQSIHEHSLKTRVGENSAAVIIELFEKVPVVGCRYYANRRY